jgi:hypothetical protein
VEDAAEERVVGHGGRILCPVALLLRQGQPCP